MEKIDTLHQNTHSDSLEQTLATPILETTSTHADEKQQLLRSIRAAEALAPDSPEYQIHQQEVTTYARELAARILAPEISSQLGLKSKIADDLSFDHPPRPTDVIVLAQAADMSKDPTVEHAFRNALVSLPIEVQSVFDRAYFTGLETGRTFTEHFNPSTDELDLLQKHEQGITNVYIDPSLTHFDVENPVSEQNEQLTRPVGLIGRIAVDASGTPTAPTLALENEKSFTYRP